MPNALEIVESVKEDGLEKPRSDFQQVTGKQDGGKNQGDVRGVPVVEILGDDGELD